MKVLIIFTSILAIALAEHYQHYSLNIPVIGKTGVPLESAAIVDARHAHLSHVAAIKSHQANGYYGRDHGEHIFNTGYQSNWYNHNAHYDGSYALPIIGHNGVPVDTAEVQAAKAAHFAAHAKASSGLLYGGHYRQRRSLYGNHEAHTYAQIGHDGKPIETPAVQALKHAHFAAHAETLSRVGNGHNLWNNLNTHYNDDHSNDFEHGRYHGSIHIPVIGHNGVPIDTPEVQHARNQHIAALSEASLRASLHGQNDYHYNNLNTHYNNEHTSDFGHGGYHGSIHIPVIGHNGVPIDTPEVQHARQQHIAALVEASSKTSHGGYEDGQYY